MKPVDIEKKQCDRLLILYLVCCKSSSLDVKVRELAYEQGLKNGKFEEAYRYLLNEKLLVESQFKEQAHLSHEGVKLIEWAIMNPDKKQEHYTLPALNE